MWEHRANAAINIAREMCPSVEVGRRKAKNGRWNDELMTQQKN